MRLNREVQNRAIQNRAINWARQHRIGVGLSAGFLALYAAAYGFFAARDPYSETIFPPCIVLHLFGFQCPGCGGTRAMYSLLHGDVAASLVMNPVVVAGYVTVAISLVGVLLQQRGGKRSSQTLYWIAGAVTVGAILWSGLIRDLLP